MRSSLLLPLLLLLAGCLDRLADRDRDGWDPASGDCDEADPSIHPRAGEACDGIDNDCDGENDSVDRDFDGVGACDGDCDDADATVNPTGVEVCDGADDNCDGVVDEGFDADGDGTSSCGGDCIDTDDNVGPDADERCNGLDDNCDEEIDEGWDEDGDGYTSCGTDGVDGNFDDDCDDGDDEVHPGALEQCDGDDWDCNGIPGNEDADDDGLRGCAGDCDDLDASVRPGLPEQCDGVDDDCDLQIDEDFDQDADGWTTCDSPADCIDTSFAIHPEAPELCDHTDQDCDGLVDEDFDQDLDGYTTCALPVADCDDDNPTRRPGAPELCNGVDDNCNGSVDEGIDVDGDGFTPCGGDCNDTDPLVNTGATELCNGQDDDCDTDSDEGFDQDGDGVTTCAGDCDDGNPAVHPGAVEDCNGIDDDCDGSSETGFDQDGDGAPTCGSLIDCDDNNALIFPGAIEACDGLDNDCNSFIPPGEDDDDLDGSRVCSGDCDDADPANGPLFTEVCDGGDNNCDSLVDEGWDADGDGVAPCVGDCDDNDPLNSPLTSEVCDGQDNDCGGDIDEGWDLDVDGITTCGADLIDGTIDDDCDDTNPLIAGPFAEMCDALDNDCDLVVDDGWDADGDLVTVCGPDGVFTNPDDDCDDNDPLRAGTFVEVCDSVDNDCDTLVDDGFDLDGDGVSTCGGDCDDADPLAFPGNTQDCSSIDTDCDGLAGNLDDDNDGSLLCDDCDDTNAAIHPGAPFPTCDGTDWDCDGAPETVLRVAFLPGQQASWANLPALVTLANDAPTLGSCDVEFIDISEPITQAALDAALAHVALLSSPGEACHLFDSAERVELRAWLSGNGRGMAITGTLGGNSCMSYTDRYELATLAGVTLSSTNPGSTVVGTATRFAGTFWTGIAGSTFPSSGSTVGDAILGTCTGAVVDGNLGGRQIVAYSANPALPCLTGAPMDHRGAWLPWQPEDGGSATDRRLLYNALQWLKN